jgi:cobalt-zinc-cadmium efflux system membrane fusion protein
LADKEHAMTRRRSVLVKSIIFVVLAVVLVGISVAAMPRVKEWLNKPSREQATAPEDEASARLVVDEHDRPVAPPTLWLSGEVIKALGVKTVPAELSKTPRALPPQAGQLAFDTNRLFPVRSRFPGEVVKITEVPDLTFPTKARQIGFGDRVEEGEVLAVVYSKDLGDKKAALVDALLDLWLDQERLQRQAAIYAKGAIPEATYRQSEYQVKKDLHAVETAERTLLMSRLTPEEIEEVRKEARAIQQRFQAQMKNFDLNNPPAIKEALNEEQKKRREGWAKLEVKAPRSGTIVQQDTNVGDFADPTKDPPLFRIADLSVLGVWVDAAEELLPLLRGRRPEELHWKVELQANVKARLMAGPILRISPSIDPNQHTLRIIGQVVNPDRKLLAGQFITATISVPPAGDEVEVPTNALNEVGGESLLFVQRDPAKPEYTLRRVAVVRRFRDVCHVRSELTPDEVKESQEDQKKGLRPIKPLRPGDLVVVQGAVELTAALEDLQAKAKTEDKGTE